jgi:alanine racemase
VHACNSAATLKFPAARFDLVRCGIAIYGLDPSSECPLPDGFRPVLTWKAVLASVRTLPPGHGVGYGHEYITTHYERIGTIPVGYADGLRRKAPNEVLIRGVKLPLFSRDCMDQAMLSLEALPEASQGDEVVLIGRQAGQRIRAEDVALRWNTNNYEVATSMAARLPRIYLNQD